MIYHHTVKYSLQLLVNDHDDENDLVTVCRILCEIVIESCSEIFKSIVELSNIAVISKLCNIREIELDAFVIRDQFETTRINLAVIVKNQSMRSMRDNRALRSQQIVFCRKILLSIL